MKTISFMSNLTRKSLLMVGSGFVLPLVVVFSSAAADSGMRTLHGHVPAIVSQLQPLGQLSVGANLNLAIGLPLRNQDTLTNLLAQIYDPASTNYHKYLTPAQFTEQFGPTAQDYQTVSNFARQNGLTVIGTHPNRVLLDVAGTVTNIQRAFHVTLRTYHDSVRARSFFAPDAEPTVATTLPILSVGGLDNYYLRQPNLVAEPSGGRVPSIGSGPGGSYQGSDFHKAYVPGTALTGAGQNVGLLQFDGFYPSDIAAYASQIGLTNVPNLVVVPVDGGVPEPTPIGNPEVSLDIEMILSMSPGVSNIYVYEAPNPSPWVDILGKMADDNLAKQLSSSWGGGPPDAAAEQIFQQMALQGQTFFNASGDSCAYTGLIPFPSDSPHITVVGGTTLTTGPGVGYTSETVWNWGIEFGEDGIGSSGGISPTYPIPTWQTNVNMTANKGSTTKRNIPDVALTGDNVWVIYGAGQSGAFGGTSCAAPLWAGFTALINQQATNNGNAPVGFLNPALYAIAAGTGYTSCFHDTTTGNNEWSGSPNLFSAVTNYDLCTGLGTPNGTNLINALTSAAVTNPITHISAPLAPFGSTLSALNGGNPNGAWTLFVQDDTPLDAGIISNGWFLTLTTASPVGSAADVALSMTDSSSTVTVGGNIIYTISVTNYGVSICSNAVVSDTLPIGVTLVGANATSGSVTRSGTTVTWNLNTNLAVGVGAQLNLTVQAEVTGNLLNYAIVSAATPDPNPDNNSGSVYVTSGVALPPQLSGIMVGSNGAFQFSVTSSSGQTNVIQASTNLVNWVPIYTNIGSFIFTDSAAGNFHYRFYRDQLIGP
jgi:uncharacterized repeat protein (TIGR01451 family)